MVFALALIIFLFIKKEKSKIIEFSFPLPPEGLPTGEVEEIEVEEKVEETNSVYTPLRFDEFIGQKRAKLILKQFIAETKRRQKVMPHVIISSSSGGKGKTTLVEILAKELDVNFVETITSNIEDDKLYELIAKTDGGILFLDELHSLKREQAEKLYTAMERFKIDGKPIKPFTLVGATTELGEIMKNMKPFFTRFKIPIELEDYTEQELAEIGKQYQGKTFDSKEHLDNKKVFKIAKNSRGTPRDLIRLLEATIYFGGKLDVVLDCFNIIHNGFTKRDLKVLRYIEKNDKGVGLSALSCYLGISATNFQFEIEPYLLSSDYILRTPRGRKITPEGTLFIKQYQHIKV